MKPKPRTTPITVYLADDHQIVLKGLASVIRLDKNLKLVGSTTDSRKIINDLITLKPRVLVLDIGMPDIPGVEIVRTIRQMRSLNTKIVIFTMQKSIGYVEQMLREGAQAYVVKDADTEHLIRAIKEVNLGQHYLSPPFTNAMLADYKKRLRSNPTEPDVLELLTRREREVLILTAQGLNNWEIAKKMGISIRTVEKHRFKMRKKAKLKNDADIAQFAMRRGLIP